MWALLAAGAVPVWAQPSSAAAAPAATATNATNASNATTSPAAPRFAIYEFEIEGNSVLTVRAVERAVSPFLGPDRDVADVDKAREALEKAYQGAGFLTVFVDVPEQNVDEGVVRLRVTEGRVEALRVTGARYYSQGVIREVVAELAPGQVPDFNAVQKQLATLQRDERQVQPVLRPGRAPGTVEAELKVNDRLPLSASVELNNRHAADTDAMRLSASLRYDNLFQRDHGLALSASTAPTAPSQSRVFSATYTAPLAAGRTLVAYAVRSNSRVEPLGAATVFGNGLTTGLRWLSSFDAADGFHTLGAGVDYKDLKELLVAGDDGISTPLRYAPFQLTYSGNWAGGPGAQTSFNASHVFALRNVLQRQVDCPGGVGAVDQFACKRAGGDGSFAYGRGELRHSMRLWGGTLAARLSAQFAWQPLPSAEQFVLGGAESVRGYLEAEASGDAGWGAALEWRSANLLGGNAAMANTGFWNELQGLVFVDKGETVVREASAGQPSRAALAGTGFGLRVRLAQTVRGEIDIAWPLHDSRSSSTGKPRLHARLQASF